jgi:hypothetical protein
MIDVEWQSVSNVISGLAATIAALFAWLTYRNSKAQAARHDALKWELRLQPEMPVVPPGAVYAEIIYRDIDVPLHILSVEAAGPRGLRIARATYVTDGYGNPATYEPSGEWSRKLALTADLLPVRKFGFAAIYVLLLPPPASVFRRSASLRIRLSVQDRSSRRDVTHITIRSVQYALIARQTSASA